MAYSQQPTPQYRLQRETPGSTRLAVSRRHNDDSLIPINVLPLQSLSLCRSHPGPEHETNDRSTTTMRRALGYVEQPLDLIQGQCGYFRLLQTYLEYTIDRIAVAPPMPYSAGEDRVQDDASLVELTRRFEEGLESLVAMIGPDVPELHINNSRVSLQETIEYVA